MTVTTRKLTAQEFLALPQESQNERWELVSGEVIVSPRPSHLHMFTVFALARILAEYVEREDRGIVYMEVDAVLARDEVRAPDILYFAKGRFDGATRKHVDVIPDLCIEVLSPTHVSADRIEKYELYESKGVAHYWIVDPDNRTIEGYALQNGRYTNAGRAGGTQVIKLPPFPELEIPLAKLWHP